MGKFVLQRQVRSENHNRKYNRFKQYGISGLQFTATLTVASFAMTGAGQALPFKKSCSSMQSHFNAIEWKENTYFTQFENKEINIQDSQITCSDGYITVRTPMGTKICKALIAYNIDGTSQWSALNNGRWFNGRYYQGANDCRWR